MIITDQTAPKKMSLDLPKSFVLSRVAYSVLFPMDNFLIQHVLKPLVVFNVRFFLWWLIQMNKHSGQKLMYTLRHWIRTLSGESRPWNKPSSYWGSPQKGHLHIGHQAEHDMDNLRPVDVLSKGTAARHGVHNGVPKPKRGEGLKRFQICFMKYINYNIYIYLWIYMNIYCMCIYIYYVWSFDSFWGPGLKVMSFSHLAIPQVVIARPRKKLRKHALTQDIIAMCACGHICDVFVWLYLYIIIYIYIYILDCTNFIILYRYIWNHIKWYQMWYMWRPWTVATHEVSWGMHFDSSTCSRHVRGACQLCWTKQHHWKIYSVILYWIIYTYIWDRYHIDNT